MKKDNIFLFVGLFSIFLIWLLGSMIIDNSLILPTIASVFDSLLEILGKISTYIVILNTLLRLLLTILISLSVACVLAVLSFLKVQFENFMKPFIVMIKTTPVVAIIILLLIFFGNAKSPYIITSLVTLPLIYEGLLVSLKNINQDVLDDVKTIQGLNFTVLKSIYLPLIFPYFMTSIIQSFGLGFKVMIMSEFIAQPNNTIGYIMQLERSNLNTSAILAWTIIVILIVLAVELLIGKLKNLISY